MANEINYNEGSLNNCSRSLSIQTFLDALPYISLILDNKGTVVCANQRWKGFCSENKFSMDNQGIGLNYTKIMREFYDWKVELVDKCNAGIKSVLTGEREVFTLEYPYQYSEGKYWFEMKVTGYQEGVLVIHEDITDSKIKEEKMNAVFESSFNIGYIIAEPTADQKDAIIKDMSPGARKIFGSDQEDLSEEKTIGNSVTKYFSDELISKLPYIHKIIKKGKTIHQKTRLKDEKGREVYALSNISSFESVGKNSVISVFMDINRMEKMRKNLKATLNSIGDAVIATDSEGYIARMNPVAEKLTGYSLKKTEGKPLSQVFNIVNARTGAKVRNPVQEVLQNGKKVGLANHTVLISKEGDKYQIADSAAPIKDDEGNIIGVVLVFRDVTEEYQIQEEMKNQKQRLQNIIEGTNVGTWEWNVQTGEVIFNEKWAEMIGYSLQELSPVTIKTWKELTHPDDLEKAEEMLEKHFQGEINQYEAEIRMKHKQGYWVWMQERGQVITWRDNGRPEWMYGIHLDIADRKRREEKIRYISYHDSLTDLYNRTYMEREIKKLDAKDKLPLSIIMADINGLKLINEAYSHKKGDKILVKAAEILRSCIREDDVLARWDGDEFVILLPQTEEQQMKDIVEKMREKSEETRSNVIPISLGLGYSIKANFNQNIYKVLHEAEDKVYKDKLTKSRSIKNRLVQNMLNTLGAKSHETKEHAQRMTNFSYKLGKKIGLSNGELNNLSLLATLHDVGKVNIAEEILKKPGSLTDEEWKAIKEHTEKGYSIASAIEEFNPVAEGILTHHERWDGDGYPQGLKQEEIPLLARIICIVDAYDVMTNGRPYKEPMGEKEAIEELKRCAGSQFDPELVEEFIEVIS